MRKKSKEVKPRVLEVSVSPKPLAGAQREPLREEIDESLVVRQVGGSDYLYFYSTIFEGNQMIEKKPFSVGPNCELPVIVPETSRAVLTFPPPAAGSIRRIDAEKTTKELRNTFK